MPLDPDIAAVLAGESDGCIVTGDCLEVMKDMPDNCVDAVVTDPPYFQPATHYCPTRDEGAPKRAYADLSILEHFFQSFLGQCAKVCKPEGSFYVFCDGQSYHMAFIGLFPYCKRIRPLVWDKIVSFNGYTWRHQHELIAWGERRASPRIPTGDGDILRCRAVPVKERQHPAEKPVELVMTLIRKTRPGGIILDPFVGSGTTLLAAAGEGRKAIGIEKEPEYASIARRRVASTPKPLFAEQPPKPKTPGLFAGGRCKGD